jgi:hypothetical protein
MGGRRMKQLKIKDFLIVGAFSFNIASIISYMANVLIWGSLIMTTIFLGSALVLIMEEEE